MIAQFHEDIRKHAESLKWEDVTRVWQQTYPLYVSLQGKTLNELSLEDKATAEKLIEIILADQKHLKGRIEPWMEQVLPLLETFRNHPMTPPAQQSSSA